MNQHCGVCGVYVFAVQQISALFNVSLNITSIDYRSTHGCLSDFCDQVNSQTVLQQML